MGRVTAAGLSKAIANITDQNVLNKIDTVIAEPVIVSLIDQLSADRENAFSNSDKTIIKNTMLNAPGSSQDKIVFLQKCIDRGYLDISRMLGTTGRVSRLEDFLLPASADEQTIYHYVQRVIGAKGGAGFNLASPSLVGAGEAFLIIVGKNVTKGRTGDLAFKGDDVEIKANGSRWHSARASAGYQSMREIAPLMGRRIRQLQGTTLTVQAISSSLDFKVTSLTSENDVEKLGVSPANYAQALAYALEQIYPKGADASEIANAKWITSKTERVKLFRAAYTKVIASAYQKTDGWKHLMHYSPEKKTFLVMNNAEDCARAAEKGVLKVAHALTFLGNSSRDMSFQYSI